VTAGHENLAKRRSAVMKTVCKVMYLTKKIRKKDAWPVLAGKKH
jgi:hypothetical protein